MIAATRPSYALRPSAWRRCWRSRSLPAISTTAKPAAVWLWTSHDELRDLVRKAAKEMHAYFQRGYTPKVKPFKGCKSCSLADICLPHLQE